MSQNYHPQELYLGLSRPARAFIHPYAEGVPLSAIENEPGIRDVGALRTRITSRIGGQITDLMAHAHALTTDLTRIEAETFRFSTLPASQQELARTLAETPTYKEAAQNLGKDEGNIRKTAGRILTHLGFNPDDYNQPQTGHLIGSRFRLATTWGNDDFGLFSTRHDELVFEEALDEPERAAFQDYVMGVPVSESHTVAIDQKDPTMYTYRIKKAMGAFGVQSRDDLRINHGSFLFTPEVRTAIASNFKDLTEHEQAVAARLATGDIPKKGDTDYSTVQKTTERALGRVGYEQFGFGSSNQASTLGLMQRLYDEHLAWSTTPSALYDGADVGLENLSMNDTTPSGRRFGDYIVQLAGAVDPKMAALEADMIPKHILRDLWHTASLLGEPLHSPLLAEVALLALIAKAEL